MKAAIVVALLVLLGAVSAMKVYDDLRWDCTSVIEIKQSVDGFHAVKMCGARW